MGTRVAESDTVIVIQYSAVRFVKDVVQSAV